RSDFSRSLFMAQKAFFIAAIYGVVLMGGFSGVAGAVQALLYRDMSEKVYMDLGTLAGFLAFTVFVGYFPDFRRGETDEHRESAQKQPRFIEILFGYIMVPIVLALTVVLLLWAGKTVVTGTWPSFEQLAGIAAAYAAGGIWLHIMVTRYETGIAGFYRRVYPIAALVILAFEAWALAVQLGKWGLRTTEYIFLLLWVVTAAASVLLIFMREKAHTIIAAVLCAVAVFSVLPAVGYHALPVAEQTARLERLLTENGMFEDGKIVPAVSEPERSVRESVTETVSFLAYAEDAKLPAWFVEDLNLSSVFRETFGFEQIWPQDEDATGVDEGDYLSTYLTLPSGAVDIGGYRWAVNPVGYKTETGQDSVTIDGDRGTYRIYWTQDYEDGIPNLKITLNDDVILEEDLSGYIDRITEAFPPSVGGTAEATLADMSVQLESPEITVLLVFSDVSISVDTRLNAVSYWFDLSALYLNEKP
nr:DUF4153 domain-containing protein [Oscillospiraceae bacterium]